MGMGVTEVMKKSGLTAVVLVLLAFIAIDLSVAIPGHLEKMQAKAKSIGLDTFDYAIFFLLTTGCVGKTIAAFMNKSWTRWSDQRDEERKTDTAIARAADEREQARRDFGGGKPPPPTA